ncbi:MAG: hypothetical protein AAFV53_09350 [Myxococcota bacterium]
MTIDKPTLKQTLLSLEAVAIAQAQAAYEGFVGDARVDRTQTVDLDAVAQNATSRDTAARYEVQVREHEAHLKQIQAIDFSPRTVVAPGAVVKLSGQRRTLIVSVPTALFECQGEPFLGISTDAPLYEAMSDLEVGDEFDFGDKTYTIEHLS